LRGNTLTMEARFGTVDAWVKVLKILRDRFQDKATLHCRKEVSRVWRLQSRTRSAVSDQVCNVAVSGDESARVWLGVVTRRSVLEFLAGEVIVPRGQPAPTQGAARGEK
jgi:hypothetical protein